MTLNRMLLESVTLVRPSHDGGFDEMGNPIEGEPVEETVKSWVEPLSTQSRWDRQSQVEYGYRMQFGLEHDLDDVTHIRWQGDLYRVEGQPLKQPAGFIVDGFQRVDVKRVER